MLSFLRAGARSKRGLWPIQRNRRRRSLRAFAQFALGVFAVRKVALVLVFVCLTMCGCAASGAEEDTLTAVFYDVGKADAILLYTEDAAVLVDAGVNKSGEDIVADLHARGIERLDALIITHFDKDHVGGADKVIEGVEIARVLEPDYEKDSKQFRQYREALYEAGLQAEAFAENVEFALDGCNFAIDVANASDYGEDEENDFSLVVRVTHGAVRFLLAGDAENARLAELLDEGDLQSDVLKTPHHGRYAALSAAFFQAVSPEYAVITSDAEDLEDAETVYALELAGARVLLTREGTVEMTSNGDAVRIVEQ